MASKQRYKGYLIYRDERTWYVVGSDPTGGWSIRFRTLKAARAYVDKHPRLGEEEQDAT